MKTWLDAYFGFSKREFNGLLVLVTLIILISAVPYLYKLTLKDIENGKNKQLITQNLVLKNIAVQEPAIQQQHYLSKDSAEPRAGIKEIKHQLFHFDPNTIDAEEWQMLGLSARQSASVLKYIGKGGRFNKPEDLKKIYVITDEMYHRLMPYVKITTVDDASKDHFAKTFHFKKDNVIQKAAYVKPVLKVIELNMADTAALEEVKGIGPVFANRIIKYRKRIGGFYKKEQLMEVFGLDSVKYEEIRNQITVDASIIKKVNINVAKPEDFKNHPYIRYKQVNALIAYRKQHGNYSNIADLNKVAILNEETIARLAPYLTF